MKLTFICFEAGISLKSVITIVSVFLAVLCIGMITVYCVLRHRLADATRINNQYLAEMRVEEEERRVTALEKTKEI